LNHVKNEILNEIRNVDRSKSKYSNDNLHPKYNSNLNFDYNAGSNYKEYSTKRSQRELSGSNRMLKDELTSPS